MKVGIIGTRGIPNAYGGFEQFAEQLSAYLVAQGEEVWVYNSSLHPYQESSYKGVHLIHCRDMEDRLGTAGQFVYDLNCIRDSRSRDFDILLQLGYTSSSIWAWMLPKKPVIITNMDGLEWRRSKFSAPVQAFLKRAERWAVRSSDHLVADSTGIQSYLEQAHGVRSEYIAYAAEIPADEPQARLDDYGLSAGAYDMLIARMEPENNIETILDGQAASSSTWPMIVIGKCENDFAQRLVSKYAHLPRIRFLGGIYDQSMLHCLRQYSRLYFHGHSVGGTNPSLLEAMASGADIIAHDNEFNRAVLERDADYFSDADGLAKLVDSFQEGPERSRRVAAQRAKIQSRYSPQEIFSAYARLFERALAEKSNSPR